MAAKMVLQKKLGWVVSKESDMVKVLNSLIKDRDGVLKNYHYCWQSCEEFSRKNQTARLSEFLENLLENQT